MGFWLLLQNKIHSHVWKSSCLFYPYSFTDHFHLSESASDQHPVFSLGNQRCAFGSSVGFWIDLWLFTGFDYAASQNNEAEKRIKKCNPKKIEADSDDDVTSEGISMGSDYKGGFFNE
jgi:hypothetical protein